MRYLDEMVPEYYWTSVVLVIFMSRTEAPRFVEGAVQESSRVYTLGSFYLMMESYAQVSTGQGLEASRSLGLRVGFETARLTMPIYC